MEQSIVRDPTIDNDRVRAAEMLAVAERNPVLSDKQSCGVAQAYALLAIEQRLAQLCAALETAVVALAGIEQVGRSERPRRRSEPGLVTAAVTSTRHTEMRPRPADELVISSGPPSPRQCGRCRRVLPGGSPARSVWNLDVVGMPGLSTRTVQQRHRPPKGHAGSNASWRATRRRRGADVTFGTRRWRPTVSAPSDSRA